MAAKVNKGPREFFRKFLVSLKRKPHMIPLVVLAFAFIWYSFNLTQVSNTTSLINGPHMGLSEFATMLFSALSLVCFLNAFPHRKKVNIPMLCLMFIMVGIIIYCDIYYGGRITNAITRADNPIDPTGANSYITAAQNMLKVHQIILIIGAALTALLPVYAPLLRKVNTSIEVAENDEMGALDLRGQDD
jgi:glucan phosphoethanolaminetransferase (alkaline phosphatase superfamily)